MELLIKNQHNELVKGLFSAMDALGSSTRAHDILNDKRVRHVFNSWLVQFSENREGILADLFNKDFFKDHINTCLDGEVYWSRIAQYTNLEFNSSNRVAPSL